MQIKLASDSWQWYCLSLSSSESTSTKTFFEHRTVRSQRKTPRQWGKNEFEWWLISNLFQSLLYLPPPPRCQFCLSRASALWSALPCSYSLERAWLELPRLAMITNTGARGRQLWARTLICHSLKSLFFLMVSIQRIAQRRWHWLLTYSECGRLHKWCLNCSSRTIWVWLETAK